MNAPPPTGAAVTPPRRSRGRSVLRPAALIVGLLGLASSIAWLALHRITPEDLLSWAVAAKAHATANLLPAAALFGAIVFAAAACAIPIGAILTATGGFLFGGALAGAVAVVCAALGATVLFCVVRRFARLDRLGRSLPRFGQIASAFRSDAVSYLLFLRLTPAPFVLVTISAAAARVGLATFAWTTALGILPMTFAHAFAGAAVGATAAAQRRTYEACLASQAPSCVLPSPFSILADPTTVVAIAAVGALALVPLLLRKLLRRGPSGRPATPSG